MNKAENQTMKVKETKNRIKADFERTPFWERMRAKFINLYTIKKVVWYIFKFLLLLGISYVILFPFYSKIASSFMSKEDFVNVTVRLIPRNPTLGTYKAIIVDNKYFIALLNTFVLSLVCAVLQTFVSCLVGYGFAKFKFKGNNILFMLVIFTMVVPHSTLYLSMFMKFRYFDIFGIVNLLGGGVIDSFRVLEETSINMINTNWPLYILSATGLAYKNGLYIFLMRQFFKGIPDELEESAYLDGYGVFKTFFKIIIPLSVTMMITVFMFSFCWQWTDNFYTEMFYTTTGDLLLPDIVKVPKSIDTNYAAKEMYTSAIRNTCGILIVAPLIVLYLFGQKYIVQGIERSGITG
ncbi:MAG: carbohydrate ABC transporter permease [Ruminococcaceae bacterium]|nr:carbohydrate ABC transporter permease [Oscillospiraceae bacterium]